MATPPRVVHTKHLDLADSEEAAAAGELVISDWNDDHELDGVAGLDSPAFVNTPTAPTPPAGDASTRLATMEALSRASAGITQTVTLAMSPYVPAASEAVLLVDTSLGPVTINLTASATRSGLGLVIKDATGNAKANPITANCAGAETADTAASIVIDSNFAAVKLHPKPAGGYAVV